jgi:hypothetical protein
MCTFQARQSFIQRCFSFDNCSLCIIVGRSNIIALKRLQNKNIYKETNSNTTTNLFSINNTLSIDQLCQALDKRGGLRRAGAESCQCRAPLFV